MLTSVFYKLLDNELIQILDKNQDDQDLHKHKDISQNKGYAFMIWFLSFYSQKKSYKNYITDGKDDASCDIIFSNFDVEGKEIFYVVQSKWLNIVINEKGELLRKNKGKSGIMSEHDYPQIAKEEFNAVISDFSTLVNGSRKEGKNEKFNHKYKELITHLEKNGKAKFIFFTAADHNAEINDTITSFNKENAPNIELLTIDINRIKKDYIEFKFKEIVANNPLEYNYYPEDREIELEIERYKNGDNTDKYYLSTQDMLQFEGRMQAYIFLLKPKTIHQLFKQYKFNLFFKNVRNPLHASNYNEKMVETLLRRPDTFWYFNNGITAITKRIPDVGKNANIFTVKGLQVINGAQTIYSIYQAYENATYQQREVMDTDARVSFRLIRSSDEDFNLEITRYTNRQNEMQPRDFVANLDEQQRLQMESFQTNYWYEKRRDEFRYDKEVLEKRYGVHILSNEDFIIAYAAFYLQKPTYSSLPSELFFLKHTEDKRGLYEEIFNENTKFEDMLAAYFIHKWVLAVFTEDFEKNNTDKPFFEGMKYIIYPVIALTKIVMQKYFHVIYPNTNKMMNTSRWIIETCRNNDEKRKNILTKVIVDAKSIIYAKTLPNQKGDNEKLKENFLKLITNPNFYEIIKQEVEEIELKIEDIETIDEK